MGATRLLLYALSTVSFAGSAFAGKANIPICGAGPRVTCVVDGDTVWLEGVKYRFEEIDTPEKGALAECMQEGLQAIEATKRLADILSSHEFTIKTSGTDRYGRTLARFVIGETTAGEMLVAEGLARPWTGAGPSRRAEPQAGLVQEPTGPRPGSAGVHRRDRRLDQDGPSTRPGAEGPAAARRHPAYGIHAERLHDPAAEALLADVLKRLFDPANGGEKTDLKTGGGPSRYSMLGAAACEAATEQVRSRSLSAGADATTADLKGGFGAADTVLADGARLASFVR